MEGGVLFQDGLDPSWGQSRCDLQDKKGCVVGE